MKKRSKIWNMSLVLLFLTSLLISCGQSSTDYTTRNPDTAGNVNKAGGPPIRDTATINKDRRDSAKMPKGASERKGNVDPSGRTTPKPVNR